MKIILLFAFIITVASCKKDTSVTNPPTDTDSKNVFPQNIQSDVKGEYFIDGTFNGKYLCFSPTSAPVDSFANEYFFDESMKLDQLNLIRMNNEGTSQMQIYLGQSKMQTRTLPYSLPHDNLAQCEFTQFQFYDEAKRFNNENGPDDNYTYQASTNTGMHLTVSSFTNNIIEGTFDGTLRTNTGLVVKVSNGSFKIKIYIAENNSGNFASHNFIKGMIGGAQAQ